MIAILKFNLPEEDFKFQTSVNGDEYYFLIKDLLEELRQKLKYSELTSEQTEVYEKIREFIYENAAERNLNLELG